jgi:hypothetical protein
MLGVRTKATRTLAIMAIAVTVLVSVFAGSSASAQTPSDGILPAGEWSDLQRQVATDLVRWSEQELPAFSDVNRLRELGFVDIGVLTPGGYAHWVNVGWMSDSHFLDPRYPESVVLKRDASGQWQVQAAMFFLTPTMTMDQIPEFLAWFPGWHVHPELCADDVGRVVGIVVNGQCAQGRPALNPMLHVWIVDNQCGHRFGGLDGGGLHCEYEHDHGHDMHDMTT